MKKKNTDAGIIEENTIKTNTKSQQGIKVVVHIPEKIHENTRRQKINRIYDILTP